MEASLSGLVEALATAGGPEPDPQRMKELKRRCKACPGAACGAYEALRAQLSAGHSEVRLGAFRVLEALFCRSHALRARAAADLPTLLALAGLAPDPARAPPPPPPAAAARQLRRAALRALRRWHRRYAPHYPPLRLAPRLLRRRHQVDLEDISARSVVEIRRSEERQKRLDVIYKNKAQRAEKELEDVKLQENEDNTAIINTLTDAHKRIRNKFLPSVQSWIQLFTRAGISDGRLRKAISLKAKLESALEKHKQINIEYKEKRRKVMKASDSSSDEFVEVSAKEGYEPRIPDHLRKEYGLEPLSPPKTAEVETAAGREPKEDELDPTCASATWKMVCDKLPRTESPNTRNSELATTEEHNKKHGEEKSKAPVVPFGLDLLYWGQEQPTAGKILKASSQHRFWAPNEMEEEVENKDVAGLLKTRCITFAGTFEPVQHRCRAPMPNGSLCGRQDRVKCPFHGKIIPRDEFGSPVNPEDRDREAKKQFEQQEKKPEWQDPEFMREVEAATGVDLGSSRYCGKGGKSKGKKKKYPNLTDLKQQANTSRSRLGKKVFDKISQASGANAKATWRRQGHGVVLKTLFSLPIKSHPSYRAVAGPAAALARAAVRVPLKVQALR
ncbi:UV-stimulated scaffold protein A isoform X3 [Paroedura picta]|uniref:UV-stimulated scaffold protein A isoform X3 n=1 Tax=Paroedura picta TaxID=143630 RepID=UPI004056D937